MKKSLIFVLFTIGLAFISYFIIFAMHVPTIKDNRITGQILADAQILARTNLLFKRPITSYQEKPNWSDGHIQVSTFLKKNSTTIYVVGSLNDVEKNAFRDIALKLGRRYDRVVDLKFDDPQGLAEVNISNTVKK